MPFLGIDHARTDPHLDHIYVYARVRRMLRNLANLMQDYGICVTGTQDYNAFLKELKKANKAERNLAVVVVHESLSLEDLKKRLKGMKVLYLASEKWLRLNSMSHHDVVEKGYYFVLWESSDRTARENWVHEMVSHMDFEPKKPKKRKSSIKKVGRVGKKKSIGKKRWGRAKQ